MRFFTLASSLVIAGGISAGAVLLAPSFAAENPPTPKVEPQWLSIPQVHEKLEAAGYRDIEKIERERGGYEVRATDRNGARIKLLVNPRSGEVLDRLQAGKRGKADGERRRRDGTTGADCNERRCRDDLPQQSMPQKAMPAPR